MYCNCFARQIYEFLRKLVHGCKRGCCGQREPRRSAFPDGCGGFRQALGLAVASAHHLTITRMEPASARCERQPAPYGPPRHPPLPGVSLFRRFRCYLDLPSALHGSLRLPPLPGVRLFRHFRCYLDLPPALHGSPWLPSLPGVSRFRPFYCYLDFPAALHGPPRLPSLPGVSRNRRWPLPGCYIWAQTTMSRSLSPPLQRCLRTESHGSSFGIVHA